MLYGSFQALVASSFLFLPYPVGIIFDLVDYLTQTAPSGSSYLVLGCLLGIIGCYKKSGRKLCFKVCRKISIFKKRDADC